MNGIYIGVDLGGTTAKIALARENGEFINKWEVPTDTSNHGTNILKNIADSIFNKMKALNISLKDINGAAIGSPGFIDYEKGEVALAPNIGWYNYPVKREFERLLGIPVAIENDANAAAIGEMWLGAGKGTKNMIAVTLGTGVGGGIIVDGEVISGVNGMGGEIGHIVVDINGMKCGCGLSGCLETISSATGIKRMAEKSIHNNKDSVLYSIYQNKGRIETKDVFDEAKNGDTYAIEIVKKTVQPLALVITNTIHTINPELVVIGGGVSKAGDYLLEKIDSYLKKYTLPRAYKAMRLAAAELGNDAGVIGAIYLAKK